MAILGIGAEAHRRLSSRRTAEIVADELRQQIIDGRLADGDLLPGQKQLVEHFNVSLVSVREALRILETEGLVSVNVGAHPHGYELDPKFTKGATIEYDQRKALEGADYVQAKNWSSYRDYGQVLSNDPSWMLTSEHMRLTDDAKFIHCLPVRRNVEVSDEVLDAPGSLIIQEAGNRTFSMQTVLHELLKQK
jgi:DNA-binding transcriptional regulator YhcF (GntR family)